MKTALQNQFHHSKINCKNQFRSINCENQLHSRLFKTNINLNHFRPINQEKSQRRYKKCGRYLRISPSNCIPHLLNFTIMILPSLTTKTFFRTPKFGSIATTEPLFPLQPFSPSSHSQLPFPSSSFFHLPRQTSPLEHTPPPPHPRAPPPPTASQRRSS